jgi:PAS domain S-box-containing protein
LAGAPRAAEFVDRILGLSDLTVWRIDLATGRVHFNAAGFPFDGLQADQAGLPVEAVRARIHPDDLAAVLHAADEALDCDTVVDVSARYRHRDGSWRTLLTRRVAERDAAGRAVALVGVALDVTRRQREQAQRERTDYALRAAAVGLWERDAAGRITHWSEAMYRLRGLDPADPRSPDLIAREITEPDDQVRVERELQQALASGQPYRAEFRVRLPDGRWRWLATQGQAVHGPGGQLLGAAGINLDITERRRADELRREKERLEQAGRERAALMARMSHALRTPLNAVLGFTRLLEEDLLEPPGPRQRERLARIAAAGERLAALVDDVLEVARLDAAAQAEPALVQPVPLHEALREAQAAVAAEAEHHGVAVAAAAPASARVLADRQRLVQALAHVLHQAVVHAPRGARLWLRAAPAPGPDHGAAVRGGAADAADAAAAASTAAAAAAGGAWALQLWRRDPAEPSPQPSLFAALDGLRPGAADAPPVDDDPAAAAAAMAALDAALERAAALLRPDGARLAQPQPEPRDAAGAGGRLGAAGSRRGDEAGGARGGDRADAADDPGADAGESTWLGGLRLSAAGDAPARPRGGLHVLYVEDNPVNLQLVCEVLALRPQVRLRTAVDGRSGLAAARAEPPDLLLLDLQLPDMHGSEVLRQLRADPALRGTMFVALSADAMPEHIDGAMALGFDAYWTKPIHFDRFLADIDRLARERGG